MPYLLLIEWGNCDKTYESFQFLKDAKHAFESYKHDDGVEYMQLVIIGEDVESWSNPDCCPEQDF
jgi:hypothetical protein